MISQIIFFFSSVFEFFSRAPRRNRLACSQPAFSDSDAKDPAWHGMTVVPEYLEETDALSWASFWVGSVGAAMMMAGYFSLLRGFLTERSPYYHALNAGGGVLAATGALLEALMGSLGAYPLVVLEGVWGLLGLIELVKAARASSQGVPRASHSLSRGSVGKPLPGPQHEALCGAAAVV